MRLFYESRNHHC